MSPAAFARLGWTGAALVGVSDGDVEHAVAAFGIKTVRDLGTSKYYAVAQARVALSGHSGLADPSPMVQS